MLTTRLVTIAVVLPLVLAGLCVLPGWLIAVVFAALMGVGAWEWGRLLDSGARLGGLLCVAVELIALILIISTFVGAVVTPAIIVSVSALVVGGISVAAILEPDGWAAARLATPASGSVLGTLALAGSIAAVVWIASRADGRAWLLVFFALIWSVDSAGYIAGRLFGKRRLAPAISPGKTWAGAIAGLFAAAMVGALAGLALSLPPRIVVGVAVVSMWVAITAIAGDLGLSLVKRRAGVKDSGFLFPGHGGVLDRLDAAIAAAPWFAIGIASVI